MGDHPQPAQGASAAVLIDCWTSIGVQGDGSCPELKQYVHCRNCPVYSAGASRLLDGEAVADDLAAWTRHFAQPTPARALNTQSIVIFRVGSEWLALPTAAVIEVADLLPIHSLPHRASGVILGLTSVRGELLVCVSLLHLLGLKPSGANQKLSATAPPRLLVLRRDQVRAVCPVDEVHGIHRFDPRELKDLPATVARAGATYSKALLAWREHSVGLLDDERVFHTLKRSLT